MNATEQIRLFTEFFESKYNAEILEKVRKGENFLIIDFAVLSQFDPDLADLVIDHPEDALRAAELSINRFDLPKTVKNFHIRVCNLPESQKVLIRNIRSKHIGKLLWMEGVIRKKSDVRPQVTAARFECPSCGNVLNVLQLDKKFKEPTKCGCGRKGKFKLLSKELVDAQGVTLEEIAEDLEGGAQPKRLQIFLTNDLVSPISEKRTSPGSRVLITGILKEVPIILRSGGQSTQFDLMMDANYVEPIEEDFTDISISDAEREEIFKLSKDPRIEEKLANSIAPSIYGHEQIKKALVLQLLGGVRKKRDDGVVTRGDMHILLIGDPGAGKSMMLKRVNVIAPRGRFISGKGVSGAGLTASVVKDDFIGGWSLEAGALVLAHKGVICIDELDKMSPDDRSAMHEALEGQTITISKANIQATLRCETTVLAAANPKFGRFDPYDTVANQIELPSTLINRFDLIFPIKDIPEEKKDTHLAKFILHLHQNRNIKEPDIDTNLLKKYVAYARQNIKPKLTDAAIESLQEYFIEMRSAGGSAKSARSVPISARQLEGLVRLTEANAKIRLAQRAARKDAKKAIELLDYSLRLVAFDEETGKFDIDRIATDTPSSQRNKIILIKEILAELEGQIGKIIPMEDLVRHAKEKGFEEDEVEEIVQKLKRMGDLFEPKRGFISKLS